MWALSYTGRSLVCLTLAFKLPGIKNPFLCPWLSHLSVSGTSMCLLPKQNSPRLSSSSCALGDSCLTVAEWEAGGCPAPLAETNNLECFVSFICFSFCIEEKVKEKEKESWECVSQVGRRGKCVGKAAGMGPGTHTLPATC